MGQFSSTYLFPGFNIADRHRDDRSFAPATSFASAMIIHEYFVNQGQDGRREVFEKMCSAFPLIPIEVIEQAIAFKERAVRNMNENLYIFNTSCGIVTGLHNVWDMFDEFNISDRFTNNPDGFQLTGPTNAIQNRQRAMALSKIQEGHDVPRFGRCVVRQAREMAGGN